MWGTGEDDWYPRQLCVPKGRLESNTVLYIMTHVYPPDPHNLLSNCYTSDKFILCAARCSGDSECLVTTKHQRFSTGMLH